MYDVQTINLKVNTFFNIASFIFAQGIFLKILLIDHYLNRYKSRKFTTNESLKKIKRQNCKTIKYTLNSILKRYCALLQKCTHE